jgi:alcohol dehydrogenase YqhD (iron-dependent ADH family)
MRNHRFCIEEITMESFVYNYPTKNYFGKGAVEQALQAELPNMGTTVMLAYGGGSIKRSGLYDKLVDALQDAGHHEQPHL